jgi:mannosyl-3-phosphoglycerate phosphatase
MQREYQETVVSTLSDDHLKRLDRALEKKGLVRSEGGRFMGVGGKTDKGIAATVLASMFRKKYGEIVTVGIGDSFNDIPLFVSVDVPVLVQQPDTTWAPVAMDSLHRVREVGPKGWKSFVEEWLV